MHNHFSNHVIKTYPWRLYLATDNRILDFPDPTRWLESVIQAGVTTVQLRLKNIPDDRFIEMANLLIPVTRRNRVPLIINDRVDIMLKCNAAGVHVGRNDQLLSEVRRLARGRIVGYSVNNSDHLDFALTSGVDYVGMGPVFPTGTKLNTSPPLGLTGLRLLARACKVPCVGIGGITPEHAGDVLRCGVSGVCVISTILGAADPVAAVHELLASMRELKDPT